MLSRARRGAAALAFALAMLVLPAGAQAAPLLSVTNSGQPSAPVEVAQTPLELSATGSCSSAFSVETAGSCPAGTWPGFGGSWAPREDAAGGDTLRLQFSASVSSVAVASTTNYPPGATDPDGRPLDNYDVIAEAAATATADPTVWTVTLPAFDARAIGNGYTFSVVARDASGPYDYPFAVGAPRWADERAKCGPAYYSTGWSQTLCSELTKPLRPAVLTVESATYDGSVLALRLRVPSAGRLRLGIPTKCAAVRGARCHRKTWVSRRVARGGRLTIRVALAPRLGRDRKMTAPLRFATGSTRTVGKLVFRVKLYPGSS